MIEYAENIKLIANYGALTIIAGAFVWDKLHTDKMIINLLSKLEVAFALQQQMLQCMTHENEENKKMVDYIAGSLRTANATAERIEDKNAEIEQGMRELIVMHQPRGDNR